MRHPWLILLLGTLILPGCATLSKNMATDPVAKESGARSFGFFIEDANIERKAKLALARASVELDDAHIVVVSFNGNLLLAGQVSSDSLRTQADNIARGIRHVRHVHNELRVSGNSGFLARTNDAWLTSKVKSRLLIDGNTPGARTKVITESGVVYLMGLLTRAEADAVVAQVQHVGGVQKIVKIIEYID